MDIPSVIDYATHSEFSDPGAHAARLARVATDPASLHEMVTDVVVHYRTRPLTPQQRDDVDLRWISAILDAAAQSSPDDPLGARPEENKVAGCCRDHALLAVAALREQGIPARTRLGFADYLGTPGFHHDHVIVERHDGDRWVRFDPELENTAHPFDTYDIPTGEDAPFATAAEIWLATRAGRLDASRFGAVPESPLLSGLGFVHRYVLADLAHRHRCELVLWDMWGAMATFGAEPDRAAVGLTDEIAELTVQADRGAAGAEAALTALWQDERVRPARYVTNWSPTSGFGWVDLTARTTTRAVLPPALQGSDLVDLLVQPRSGSM